MESARIASNIIISFYGDKKFDTMGRSYQNNCFDSFGRDLRFLRLYKYFLMRFPEFVNKYAELDVLIKRYYIEIFNGDRKAMDPMIFSRFIRDFIMFDILHIHK